MIYFAIYKLCYFDQIYILEIHTKAYKSTEAVEWLGWDRAWLRRASEQRQAAMARWRDGCCVRFRGPAFDLPNFSVRCTSFVASHIGMWPQPLLMLLILLIQSFLSLSPFFCKGPANDLCAPCTKTYEKHRHIRALC
jgi:hypothetical protein